MSTKHDQIIKYIENLSVGGKISVRAIAKELNVSEGTAYRAIKEAENKGLVSTIERVGTVRIETKIKDNFDRLSFAEIIGIVDGQVLGGRDGLHKTLNKFVIGAMELDAMMRYTQKDALLIVGNRIEAHELAIKEGAAVLITGGFDTDDRIKRLADEKELPVISTSYDTFTVAELINRAIYDQMIKKEIIVVEDIYTPLQHTYHLEETDTLERWYTFNAETTHTRYPVTNASQKVTGMVTSKDIINKDRQLSVVKAMTKNPLTVQKHTTLAYAAHMMVWEGIEIIPVVDQQHKLQGLISRQDVLKALQQIQLQPQIGETIEDLVTREIDLLEDEGPDIVFQGKVTPQMTNQLGSLSTGVLTTFVTEASRRFVRKMKKGDMVVDNISVYFLRPIQLDSTILIKPRILEVGRKLAKMDVEVYSNKKTLVAKALLMAQLLDR